jgi:hypothetical protein
MGLVFGPENHTSHINLDKPIELRESNQSNQIKIESIKALKEIELFNHDSLNGSKGLYTSDKTPVEINEPIKMEPIKNEHTQEIIKQENQQSKIEPSVIEIKQKKPKTWAELKPDKDKK